MWKRITEIFGIVAAVFALVAVVTATPASTARDNLQSWINLLPDWMLLNAWSLAIIFGVLTAAIWLIRKKKNWLLDFFWTGSSIVSARSQEREEISSLCNSWLRPAAENINQVMQRIFIAMRKHNDTAIRGYESLLQRCIADPERAALAKLMSVLTGIEEGNTQECLGRYFRAYQENRTWVVQGVKLTGKDLSSDSIFQEWKRLDAAFLHELRRLSGPPQYVRLRQLIDEVGWGENVTRDIETLYEAPDHSP